MAIAISSAGGPLRAGSTARMLSMVLLPMSGRVITVGQENTGLGGASSDSEARAGGHDRERLSAKMYVLFIWPAGVVQCVWPGSWPDQEETAHGA
jgi:hypothetical protein